MTNETKIQFINTPLPEVIGYLKQLHHMQIIATAHVQSQRKNQDEILVTMNIEDLPLDSALDFLTDSYGLGWYVEGGMVVITTEQEANQRMSSRLYSLKGANEPRLIETIQETLEPSSWEANGGQGRLSALSEGQIVVWQNRRGHELVEALVTAVNEKANPK